MIVSYQVAAASIVVVGWCSYYFQLYTFYHSSSLSPATTISISISIKNDTHDSLTNSTSSTIVNY